MQKLIFLILKNIRERSEIRRVGNPRFLKANNAHRRRDGVRSSAMSDTSETPSLASHVRRVRVPSQASDVDQFLDDLFMPVLDGNIDDGLSDARSLAASMRGGGSDENESVSEKQASSILEFSRVGSIRRKSVLNQVNIFLRNFGHILIHLKSDMADSQCYITTLC